MKKKSIIDSCFQVMRNPNTLVLILVLVSVLFRFWAFKYYPPGWDVYYHSRIADNICATGAIPQWDTLSYGGRPFDYPFLYPAFLSAGCFMGIQPFLFAEMMSPLIFAFTLFLLYLIVRKYYSPSTGAIAVGLFSFAYSVIEYTGVNPQPTNISLFLFVLLLYLLERRQRLFSVAVTSIMPFVHLTSFALAPFMIAYGFFKKDRFSMALGAFLGVLSVGASYPYFSQYMPQYLLSGAFTGLTWDIPLRIGPIVAAFGLWAILKHRKKDYLWLSLGLISLAYIQLGLIELDRGMIFACLGFAPIAADFVVQLGRKWQYVCVAVMLLYVAQPLAVYPDFSWLQLDGQKMQALQWLENNTPADSLVVSDGNHWVSGIAHRKTYFDAYYRGMTDANDRLENARVLFESKHPNFDYYVNLTGADYILIFYGQPFFIVNTTKLDCCYERVFKNNESVIYDLRTRLR